MRGEGIKLPQPCALLSHSPPPIPTQCQTFLPSMFLIVFTLLCISCLSYCLAVLTPRHSPHLSVSIRSSIRSSSPPPPPTSSVHPSSTSQSKSNISLVAHEPPLFTDLPSSLTPPPTKLCHVAPYFLTPSPVFLLSWIFCCLKRLTPPSTSPEWCLPLSV